MKTVENVATDASFAAVKGSVQCDQVAEEETVLRSEGGHLRGTCPLPEHQGDSRSFYCYDNGSGFYEKWWCHRCNKGGDVIDLYAAMHGLEHNLVFALQAMAERFGIKLWRDTDFMSENQMKIRKAKRQAERRLSDAITSLAFSRMVIPLLKQIEDKGERARELERCLKAAGLGEDAVGGRAA
jgi:DNA primase